MDGRSEGIDNQHSVCLREKVFWPSTWTENFDLPNQSLVSIRNWPQEIPNVI